MSNASNNTPPLPPPPPDAKLSAEAVESAEAFMAGLRWVGRFLVVIVVISGIRWYTGYSPSRSANQKTETPVAAPTTINEMEAASEIGHGQEPASQPEDKKRPPLFYNYDYLIERDNDPNRSSVARLKLRWSEATPELLPLLERLTPEQRTAWGVAAVASGSDIYGAHVQLINIGYQSVEVSPAKLRVHFGDEAARVFVADDPSFLKPVVLHRGQAASGLVMFTARADIGAAIRLGEGEMAYVDPGVETVYK